MGYMSVATCYVLSLSLAIGCSTRQDKPISKVAEWLEDTREESIPSDLLLELRSAAPSVEEWEKLLLAPNSDKLRIGRIMTLSSAVFLDRFGEIDSEFFQAMCKMCLSDRMRFQSVFDAVTAKRCLEKSDLDEIVEDDVRYLARFVAWLNKAEAPPLCKSMLGVLVLSSALGREDFIRIAVEKDAIAGWEAIQEEVARNGDYYVYNMRDHKFQIDLDRARLKMPVSIREQEPGVGSTE